MISQGKEEAQKTGRGQRGLGTPNLDGSLLPYFYFCKAERILEIKSCNDWGALGRLCVNSSACSQEPTPEEIPEPEPPLGPLGIA